jgi:hypothetical protein
MCPQNAVGLPAGSEEVAPAPPLPAPKAAGEKGGLAARRKKQRASHLKQAEHKTIRSAVASFVTQASHPLHRTSGQPLRAPSRRPSGPVRRQHDTGKALLTIPSSTRVAFSGMCGHAPTTLLPLAP